MQGFFPLASGSKGNCAYLGVQDTKILIDLGIAKTAASKELLSMGIHPEEIQAIFISHEHSDHTAGLKSFVKEYNTPIVCNRNTAQALYHQNNQLPTFQIFSTGIPFHFGDLRIDTFSIPHDAEEPVGFVFHYQNQKFGFCTDLGCVTSWIKHSLHDCDHLFIESNHDPDQVMLSSRPAIYRHRVLGKTGHLSNRECGELLKQTITPKLRNIYLAHLSDECNTPSLALDTVIACIEKLTPVTPIIAQRMGVSQPIHF